MKRKYGSLWREGRKEWSGINTRLLLKDLLKSKEPV